MQNSRLVPVAWAVFLPWRGWASWLCRACPFHDGIGFALYASSLREFGTSRVGRAQSPGPGGGEHVQDRLRKRDPHSRMRIKRL